MDIPSKSNYENLAKNYYKKKALKIYHDDDSDDSEYNSDQKYTYLEEPSLKDLRDKHITSVIIKTRSDYKMANIVSDFEVIEKNVSSINKVSIDINSQMLDIDILQYIKTTKFATEISGFDIDTKMIVKKATYVTYDKDKNLKQCPFENLDIGYDKYTMIQPIKVPEDDNDYIMIKTGVKFKKVQVSKQDLLPTDISFLKEAIDSKDNDTTEFVTEP